MTNKTVCIVGMGLLGGSYAMALTQAGNTVYGIDVQPQSIAFALERGYIRRGAVQDYAPLVREADLVVLGLYPHTLVQWVKENAGLFKTGALVTDVCGVKSGVVEAVQAAMPAGAEFCASHPMRGREVCGVQNADSRIFKDGNFIITPTQKNTAAAQDALRDLALTLGFANISVLTPAQHDKMVGYVSQLTHAIAVSLMTANDNTHLKDYTGDSFCDLTRIAKINEELWSELFLWNRDNLCEEIDSFTASLQELKACLQTGDEEKLKQLFRLSTQRRAQFDKTKKDAAADDEK